MSKIACSKGCYGNTHMFLGLTSWTFKFQLLIETVPSLFSFQYSTMNRCILLKFKIIKNDTTNYSLVQVNFIAQIKFVSNGMVVSIFWRRPIATIQYTVLSAYQLVYIWLILDCSPSWHWQWIWMTLYNYYCNLNAKEECFMKIQRNVLHWTIAFQNTTVTFTLNGILPTEWICLLIQ